MRWIASSREFGVAAGGSPVRKMRLVSCGAMAAALCAKSVLWSAPQPPRNTQVGAAKQETHHIPLNRPVPEPAPQLSKEPCVYEVDWTSLVQVSRTSGMEVRLAENRVQEANANVAVATKQWLPNFRVGTSYLHHDGFIQDIPGEVINANKNAIFAGPLLRLNLDPATAARENLKARQLLRIREAQLHREVRQHFHDAAIAYIDLQHSQAGAAIYAEVLTLLGDIVNRAQNFRNVGWISSLQVQPYIREREQQRLGLMKIKQDHLAAGAKLADILDVATPCVLYSAGESAAMLKLVDVGFSEEQLVATALAQGPGISEVEFAVQSLQEQLDAARRHRFTPQLGLDLGYGAFGGGVGSNYNTWGDRTDVGVHVYWDLSELLRADANRCLFEAKRQQANLQRQQVHKKLSLGVRVALLQARSAQERMTMAEQHISDVIEQYQKVRTTKIIPPSNFRNDDGSNESERVLSYLTVESRLIGQLAAARTAYLDALIVWNKAQVTLNYLTGACGEEAAPYDDSAKPLPPPTPTTAPSNDRKSSTSQALSVPIEPVRGRGKVGRRGGPFPRLPVDDRSP
jgi:outer membrane protein TolC